MDIFEQAGGMSGRRYWGRSAPGRFCARWREPQRALLRKACCVWAVAASIRRGPRLTRLLQKEQRI